VFGIPLTISWTLSTNAISTNNFSTSSFWITMYYSWVEAYYDADLYLQWGSFHTTRTGNVILGANGGNVILSQDSSSDCATGTAWSIMYSGGDTHFYGCNGTDWKQLD
jgi:hypothetical protein